MKGKLCAWLRVIRIQFYPMTFIAYTVGATVVDLKAQGFNVTTYVLGYLFLFFLELCTILTNELYDYPTDRINRNASPFNGGSRVLVEGGLSFREVKAGIVFAVCMLSCSGVVLIGALARNSILSAVILLLLGILLALGYTVPPLKFSYRGLGELVVGITHSFYVMLCGYFFQTGLFDNLRPWLTSIPLFFATLAAICLAGIPDHRADASVSKKTFSVLFGQRRSGFAALVFAAAAWFIDFLLVRFHLVEARSPLMTLPILLHLIILGIAVLLLLRRAEYDRTINGTMQLALSYIIWFGIIPLISQL